MESLENNVIFWRWWKALKRVYEIRKVAKEAKQDIKTREPKFKQSNQSTERLAFITEQIINKNH